MKIARTDSFKKAWKKLSKEQKLRAKKAIKNLMTDTRYPALRVKKIKGTDKIWEARVSLSIRMTFQIEGHTIVLRSIGQHDETLKRP